MFVILTLYFLLSLGVLLIVQQHISRIKSTNYTIKSETYQVWQLSELPLVEGEEYGWSAIVRLCLARGDDVTHAASMDARPQQGDEQPIKEIATDGSTAEGGYFL